MTCIVTTPLGPRTVEVAVTAKPTRRRPEYTAAVAAQLQVDAAADRVRLQIRRCRGAR